MATFFSSPAKAVALSLAEETGEAPEILQLKAFNQIKQVDSEFWIWIQRL